MIWNRRKILKLFLAMGVSLYSGFNWLWGKQASADSPASDQRVPMSGPSDSTSTPVLQKPFVVQVKNPRSIQWDGRTYPYVNGIDQSEVEHMLQAGIKNLTGEKDIRSAWAKLIPYRAGEKIAIKPNFNDLYADFRKYVVSPQVLNAILHGLIDILGVPPKDVIIYDLCRTTPDCYRKRVQYSISYIEPWGSSFWRKVRVHTLGNPLAEADTQYPIDMNVSVYDKQGNPVQCYIPKCLTVCQHLINVPLFKSHPFVLASGALKNHFGTVRFSDGRFSPDYLHPPIIHQAIVDVNAHPIIRDRTRLVVMDALFGRVQKHGTPPNLKESNLFLSTNPVALDMVTSSMIRRYLRSRGETPLSHDYLNLALTHKLGVQGKLPEDSFDNWDALIDFKRFSV